MSTALKWPQKFRKKPVLNAVTKSGLLDLRLGQRAPRVEQWLTWLLLGGRGSGKTRAGAEWVHALATGYGNRGELLGGPIALIGETIGDVRDVMIDGPAGIMESAIHMRPRFEATRRRLVWPNGQVAQIFSAHEPESLRGPQFAAAWCDELCKWPHAEQVWDMLQFGLRLGHWPRELVTTTPKPLPLLKRLIADKTTVTHRMRTADNAKNLAAPFLDAVIHRYGGTSLGRQELDGEILDGRQEALWSHEQIGQLRAELPKDFTRIVVAVDPPATSKSTSDACGIVVAGLTKDGLVYVIGDHSFGAAKPAAWARKVASLYDAAGADCVIAETNQGGEMVSAVIHAVDASIPIKSVHARKSKFARAEPVAALYEQGRVRHAGVFAELEAEMCDHAVNGLSHGKSPDRMDALVWAIAELTGDAGSSPRIRSLS